MVDAIKPGKGETYPVEDASKKIRITLTSRQVANLERGNLAFQIIFSRVSLFYCE